jgi:hypothetical protein
MSEPWDVERPLLDDDFPGNEDLEDDMSANKNEVATIPAEPNGMVAMMERLALNPELPVDKLEKLLDMQIRVRAIESEQSYSAAMARVQAALPVVLKDAYNDQTKSPYATVSAIAAAIKPVYTAQGFSISFSEAPTEKPEHIRVRGTVRHRDGHKDETPYVDVAIDKAGIKGNDNKTLTHAEGSSFTYGRRYLTCLIFDVSTGLDTDGNAAGGAAFITDDQALEMDEKITAVKTNRAVFMAWLKVDALDKVRAKDFDRAMAQLDVLAAKNKR